MHECITTVLQLSDDIRFAKDDADEDKVRAQEFFFPKGAQVRAVG